MTANPHPPRITRAIARLLGHLITLALLVFALVRPGTTQAQGAPALRATSTDQVKFPAGLRWEPMREVRFLEKPKLNHNGISSDEAAAIAVWSDELTRFFAKTPNYIASVLLGQARSASNKLLTFSVLNIMDFERCEPPMNGKDVMDMYSKCLARVHVDQKPVATMKEFSGFCYLNVDDSANPLAKNHTEFAFDQGANTAYMRVIQFGKEVPACRRAIKLEGV